MGFLDGLKKAFDTGGIELGMVVPKSFRWSDGTLPITVTLGGHKEEPRTVTQLALWLREDDADSQQRRSGHREGVRMIVHGPFELAPLEEKSVEVPFALTEATRDTPWYRLSVEATVEGAGAQKMVARRIKNNRLGDWGSGQFGGSVSIG